MQSIARWAILTLATAALGGCLSQQAATLGVMDRLRAAGGPQGPDVVVCEVAVLEVPPADSFVDQELWSSADEQVVALDRKPALEENGLRVGVIGGLPPSKFQALLQSERTCLSPHHVRMHSGNVKPLGIGPVRDEAAFDLHDGDESKPVNFSQAQCSFALVPQRLPDGRVRLGLTPQVQHGGKSMWLQPAEGEGWSMSGQRPVEKYPRLAFEATVAPQEFLLVGTRYDRMRTLGHAAFVNVAGDRPAQRLLVIRARAQGEQLAETWSDPNKPAPLAFQAFRSARGTAK